MVTRRILCALISVWIGICLLHYTWPGQQQKLNVAIFDCASSGHEEVMAPLLYTLSGMPGVTATIYRDGIRPGFFGMIKHFYTSPMMPWQDLVKAEVLDETDVILFLTPEREMEKFLALTNGLVDFPHIKVVAVAHRTLWWEFRQDELTGDLQSSQWPRRAAFLSDLVRNGEMDRLSLITLSPHVETFLHRMLPRVADSPWDVHTFIPVFPGANSKERTHNKQMKTAVIQGSLNLQRRAYNRVFSTLSKELGHSPGEWGFTESDEGVYAKSPNATNAFEVKLLGRRKVGRPAPVVPLELSEIVTLYEGVGYDEYYDEIASADILLPTFAWTRLYLQISASSSMPAAIMANTPILISDRELLAYSYLRYPAVIQRRRGEDEIEAIARIRAEGSYKQTTKAEWDAYILELTTANAVAMQRILNMKFRGDFFSTLLAVVNPFRFVNA